MSNIREHLCDIAAAISDRALRDITNLEQWKQQRPERYRRYLDMQGLVNGLPAASERSDLQVVETGRIERDDVTIVKLYYQSRPGLYVTANLYVPRGLTARAPAVLYLCGHSGTQKVYFQAHGLRWAQLGFVCLIMDTIEFAEAPGDHHGVYFRGQFQWYSRGYGPAGVEMWNGIRAIDLLSQHPQVDPERIGVTGISGGGGVSWWIAAADKRVKVAAPVCGTSTLRSQVIDRSWDDQCDCLWFHNTWRWDLSEVGALVAPRPLMIASADRDQIFTIASIRECHERVRSIYSLYGSQDQCQLVETPGPHSYHPTSRKRIFSFFMRHLMGVDRPWQEIADVGEGREDVATLKVYVNGPPDDERTGTVDDDFVERAAVPELADGDALAAHRREVVSALREYTFGHFPAEACDPQTRILYEAQDDKGRNIQRLGFVSEPGVTLHMMLTRPPGPSAAATPAVLYVQEREANREDFGARVNGLPAGWARLCVEPRGTGETSSGREMQWHVRRAAALTGRTIASMQVYDVLRALHILRQQKGIDPQRISIMGSGSMAVVAMYAALLDGQLEAVMLMNPPASQNLSDHDGGTDIEMLNCVRFTDLPQVAGMLHPADLVFIGPRPSSYGWTEALYRRVGGRVVHALESKGYFPRRTREPA